MKSRLAYAKVSPGLFESMETPDGYIEKCGLEKSLLFLVQLRVSLMNGCAYCIDMHSKDLRVIGEKEQRLYSLCAWRECPYYTERERAALSWSESVTDLTNGHVPEEVYQNARAHFNEKELCDLTFAVATINAWNRLCIAGRMVPGNYQPTGMAN